MKNIFKRKKDYKGDTENRGPAKLQARKFEYHPKIILAWAKALEGNVELLKYLNENGYEELVMASHAIKLKDKARDWLMENGYPHVMAMINASEGNAQALNWLRNNNFMLFYNMARAIDDENEGFEWINKNSTQDIFLLTKSIKKVKDDIEEAHNDIHKRSTE